VPTRWALHHVLGALRVPPPSDAAPRKQFSLESPSPVLTTRTTPPVHQRAGFLHTDDLLRTGGAPGGCGTTALAAVVQGRTLVVANTGDSRAVLCRRGRGIELSTDHKPPAELERIAAAGGFVDTDGYLNGCVSVSRALGDWQLCCANKQPLKTHPGEGTHAGGPLTAEPEMRVHDLTEEDEFLILACDGLWDVLSSQGAVELARQCLRQHNDPERLAGELAREALRRHSADNVTCVVVCFSSDPPPVRPPPLSSRQSSRMFQRSISQETLADLQRHLNGGEEAGDGSPLAMAS
jgi:protein phosphatase 2C family protein 2/3